jgi:hypothetical protein
MREEAYDYAIVGVAERLASTQGHSHGGRRDRGGQTGGHGK